MEAFVSTLSAIAISTPLIIVWVIGIGLALSRWRRLPRVSQFVIIAFAVMIVNTVAGRLLNLWLLQDSDWTTIQLVSNAIGILTAIIAAAAWAMVLCAIFGWRDGSQKQDSFPPAPPTFGYEPREQNATTGFPQQ